MTIYRLLLSAAALLSAFAPLSAADWVIERSTYYLTAEQQSFSDFPAPPAEGTRAYKKDFAALHAWQDRRTAEQCAKAAVGAKAGFDEFFSDISPFPSPLTGEAAAIFKRIKIETDGVAADVKDRYKRQRPFHTDASLDPCLGRIGGLAYPSGHATISRMYALVLAELVPADKKKFLARADEAALDRVIGGVHHPSDIEAGKRLADRLFKAYRKSPVFKADLETLRSLLKKAE